MQKDEKELKEDIDEEKETSPEDVAFIEEENSIKNPKLGDESEKGEGEIQSQVAVSHSSKRPTNTDKVTSRTTKEKKPWTAEEDEILMIALLAERKKREAEKGDSDDEDTHEDNDSEDDGEEDWDEIAKNVPGRTPVQCLRRYIKTLSKVPESTEKETNERTTPTSLKPQVEIGRAHV